MAERQLHIQTLPIDLQQSVSEHHLSRHILLQQLKISGSWICEFQFLMVASMKL
jgi:hypothetical protein